MTDAKESRPEKQDNAPSGSIKITDKKGRQFAAVLKADSAIMVAFSQMNNIVVDGKSCKVVSKNMVVDTKVNSYFMEIQTSHASNAKPIKDKKTGKWVIK